MNKLEMNKAILNAPVIRNRVAHHEAGHYVTYLAYSKRYLEFPQVEGLTIKPTDSENLGLITHRPFVWGAFERPDKVECNIKQILAGFAAEYLIEDHPFSPTDWFEEIQAANFWGYDPEATDDTNRALTSLAYIQDLTGLPTYDSGEVTQALAPFFEAALIDVKRYWSLIQEVAKQLLAQEEIKGADIQRLNESITERIEIEPFIEI